MSTAAAPSLKALAESKTSEGVSKVTTFRVDPDLIQFEPGFNLRAQDDTILAHIDRLYEAGKNGASFPPIDVRVDEGNIFCVEGHCRTIAARRLKLEIPDFTLEARQFRGNEQERVLHMLGTGSGQKPLTPLEQGAGFLRLVKYGMTPPQIAAKLGVSRVTIDNGLTLAESPVEVQNMVRNGEVSSTTAREAIKQGAAGVEALKVAVAEEKAAPSPTKNGAASKKKRVTAKRLKGTAADKKAKKAAKKKPAVIEPPVAPPAVEKPAEVPEAVDASEMVLKVKRDTAQAVAEFLRANAPDDDALLKDFAASLEMGLM